MSFTVFYIGSSQRRETKFPLGKQAFLAKHCAESLVLKEGSGVCNSACFSLSTEKERLGYWLTVRIKIDKARQYWKLNSAAVLLSSVHILIFLISGEPVSQVQVCWWWKWIPTKSNQTTAPAWEKQVAVLVMSEDQKHSAPTRPVEKAVHVSPLIYVNYTKPNSST